MKRAIYALPLLFGGISSPALAGDFSVEFGAFWASTDSWISTRALDGNDIKLDFEDTLNLEQDQVLPFLQASYAFNERHAIYADWKRLHRQAETTTTFGFTIPEFENGQGGNGVVAGAKLNTRLDIDILRAGYAYNIYKDGRSEFGVSAGLHVMFIETGFAGGIGACVETPSGIECDSAETSGEVVSNSVTAPLPDLGFYGAYNFAQDWSVTGHAQLFYISVDQTKGHLADLNAGIRYHANEDWKVDLAYNYYEVKVDWKDTELKYSFQGPQLTVGYTF